MDKGYTPMCLSQDEMEDYLDSIDVNYELRMDGNLILHLKLIDGLRYALVDGNFKKPNYVKTYARLNYGEILHVTCFSYGEEVDSYQVPIDEMEDFINLVEDFYSQEE